MKAITGAILIVAAAVFFQARVDVASSQIAFVEAKELARISHAASLLFGIAGMLLIGIELLQVSGIMRWMFSTGRLLPPACPPTPTCNVDTNNQALHPTAGNGPV
jgi:Mn2+/Fe2+ NRAMP family transporter